MENTVRKGLRDGRHWRRRVAFGAAIFLLAAGVVAAAPAQSTKAAPAAAQAKAAERAASDVGAGAAPTMTAADVAAFLDGLMPLQSQQADIAGAVVVVVRDGRILFAKGYGYADVDKKVPVNAESTLFRPGSISKLFTWTSVMQLVEQGKLNLDHDVNDYLDFKIPPAFGKPIALRDIMTHTAGFEDVLKDLFCADPAKIPSLREYVVNHVPERVDAPGAVVSYSNYATALAGYIVQHVSGQPFSDYVMEHIFKPLGMSRSTFVQPLPESLRPDMSSGYVLASTPARPFELVPAAPAGALSTSGIDIARFIIAHLQNGRFGDVTILRPETAQLMHSRQRASQASLNGMALGFYEENRNGQRIIGHGGDTALFHSDLHLMLDAGVGFFVSYNSAGKADGSARSWLWQQFLDRYFPFTPPPPQVSAAEQDIRAVTGQYISSRRNRSTFLKALAVIGTTSITPGPKGTIEISGLKNVSGQTRRWQPVSPLTFRDVDGQDTIVFWKNADGRLVGELSAIPVFLFEREGVFNDGASILHATQFALAIFGLTLIFWPVGALLRKHYKYKLELNAAERRARTMARISCVVLLLFVGALLALFQSARKNVGIFNSSLDPWLRLIQLLGWLGVVGILAILYDAYLSLSRRTRRWPGKVWGGLLVLACLAWTWFLVADNVLAFSLRY